MKLKDYCLGFAVASFSLLTNAANNVPADVDTVTLRTSCYENNGATEVPNCFDSMDAVDDWLRNTRQTGPTRPTVVNIGPGRFGTWNCRSSDLTLRGSGRSRTILGGGQGIAIGAGCTNLNMKDLAVIAEPLTSIVAVNVGSDSTTAITNWTNVEIRGGAYGWQESGGTEVGACPEPRGRHSFYASKITSTGGSQIFPISRAYIAACAQSWFFATEITAQASNNETAFALEAHDAEVHLYGSNARLLLAVSTVASSGNHYLLSAKNNSVIHTHGTGLDVVHHGTGTVDMLTADASSHIHANESGFNIHVSKENDGKVRRLAGEGGIESPYVWGASAAPPLGTGSLLSRDGADSYTETDCPNTGSCSAGGDYPHVMIYRSSCTGVAPNQGPWFDTVTRACRS